MATAFVPTRFLSFSYAENGALILYNSRSGAIGAVPAEHAAFVRESLRRSARHVPPLQGILSDLQEGGFLIPEGTNEQLIAHQQFLSRYKDDQLQLILLPTEQCNFRCTYCYESFLRGQMPEWLVNGIKRYVSKQKHLKQLSISWFGGEPLLASKVVVDLSRFFYQYSLDHDIQYLAGVTTNGYFLIPELAEEIIPLGVRQFQITLDGVQEEHDKRRVLQGGGKTFDTILQNLRYLKSTKHAFVVVLRHNYDPQNVGRLGEFIDMLSREFRGDPRFSTYFFPIGRWGGANDSELAVCEGRSSVDAFLQGKILAAEAGFSDAWQLARLQPNGYVCYAVNPRSFVVGSDGNIYKCTVELDYHDRNIVGHLGEDGEMKLDWRKMALWCETNGLEEGKKCYTCFFSPACHGACCPKEWMDSPECECPQEKQAIRKVLPIIHRESQIAQPTGLTPAAQCLK